MDDFYAARSRIIPPLTWLTFSPPVSPEAMISETLPQLREAALKVESVMRDYQERNWSIL